ncbi:transposase [Candidatus Villigracilis saccharophilus]|uniref:transposase n=1 Tax=Candidatus Villigracilis saccharophilus TaxID=3140684 RepID=UPI003136DD2E|nr:transposase [Anaerolineales bacterium]
MSRFLANSAIEVRSWYKPIAKSWLQSQFEWVGEIRLIVDGTKVGFGHQLLMVSLAYRKRAVPIAWSWVKHVRGLPLANNRCVCSSVLKPVAQRSTCFLVGDSEFGSIFVLRQLDQWRWFYVLRQKTNTGLWINEQLSWRELGSFVDHPGQTAWFQKACLTKNEIYPVSALVYWQIGEKEPWCLATNLPDQTLTVRYYRRRVWIEEMFGDFKKHGFDLEHTMLRHAPRLSRLTLAVALLYVWLVSTGSRTLELDSVIWWIE